MAVEQTGPHYTHVDEVRIMQGLSQREIADILGITATAAARKLRGQRPFATTEIMILAAHLDVSPGELLCTPGEFFDLRGEPTPAPRQAA